MVGAAMVVNEVAVLEDEAPGLLSTPHAASNIDAASGTASNAVEVFFTAKPTSLSLQRSTAMRPSAGTTTLGGTSDNREEGNPPSRPTCSMPDPDAFDCTVHRPRRSRRPECPPGGQPEPPQGGHPGGPKVENGAIGGSPGHRHADTRRDSLITLCPAPEGRKIATYSSYTDVTRPHVVPGHPDLSPGHPHVDHRFVPRRLPQGPVRSAQTRTTAYGIPTARRPP